VSRVRDGWPFAESYQSPALGAIPSAVLIRKAALDTVGGFDMKQRCCEDIDLVVSEFQAISVTVQLPVRR
jgi:hypothetical protein